MFRRASFSFLAIIILGAEMGLRAQAPSAAPPPGASAPPASLPPPSTESLINTMGSEDLEQAIQILKGNFLNPEALNETELNRATLQGVLARLRGGVMLLAGSSPEPPAPPSQLFAEILDGHIGYLRLGALTNPNLQALDSNLQTFAGKKSDALVIDLRASGPSNDFAMAAEFAKRFCPKGKPLFSLRKPAAKQERTFTSEREPAYQGLTIVLADGDTHGAAEAIAGLLRFYNKALVIGQPTAGRGVEYSDVALPHGRILRVAVAETVLPQGQTLFPGGIKPDLPVEMPAAEKRQIFAQSLQKGMSPFVFETGRPHLNEAALLAGKNPEIDAMEAAQRKGRALEKPAIRDAVLQRAVDLVTSLAVYQRR